jgi:hypothetical protein
MFLGISHDFTSQLINFSLSLIPVAGVLLLLAGSFIETKTRG